ncbi:VOC family protein [uncultured Gilvimarinus sp.]|uniref:VOC family protein n=1 Tax=uncultured Gilvimarinus sp. TaxID=1689143 RepID=UPI0030EF027C|tara:strand:+ start:411 stop:818 length:408 start_codon:yes stop_codon:yes gene_type:complete
MNVNPYIFYNGNCAEAFTFYSECLGLPIDYMGTYKEAPGGNPVDASFDDKIMHVSLTIGGAILMGSDVPSGDYQAPQGISVALQTESASQAETMFNALSANGEIIMPLEKTFWAERFGLLRDKFGIKWMVNCDPE